MSASITERSLPIWTEADRLAALRNLEILDTEPEAAFDNLAKVAAHVCNAPIALISLVDEQRQWFKCEIGLNGVRETPRKFSICAHAILQSHLFIVPDTTKDPRFFNNPSVTGESHLRFYAGAPLLTDEGLPLGTLCVLDNTPRPEGLTPAQAETLLALAGAVMSQLKLRQSNKAVAERERKFRTIADAMPQMVWSTRPDGYHDYFNQRWYDFTGVPTRSTDGEGWNGLFHPDDQDRAWALWQHSLTNGEPYQIEYRLRHHSGQYHWVLGRALPIRNEQGVIERWFGTCTDIHDLKLTQQALGDSEEFTRRLLSSSDDCIKVLDLDGNLVFMSEGGQRVMEVSDFCQIEGTHWPSFWTGPAVQEALDAIDTAKTGETGRFQGFCPTMAGTPKWWDVLVTAIRGADGQPERLLSISRDITELKRTELRVADTAERYRLAARATNDAIWDWDLTSDHIQWNEAVQILFGYAPNEIGASGRWWKEHLHPEDYDQVIEAIQAVIDGEETHWLAEYRFLQADGAYAMILDRGYVLRDEQGRAIRMVGAMLDLTERKRAEEALRASEERLRLALQAGRIAALEMDLQTSIITRHQNTIDLLGIESSTLLDFMRHVHPDDQHKREQFLGDIMAQGASTLEFRYTLPDGQTRWFGLHAERSTPQRLVGIIFDVTDRKKAEGELRASEERLRLAVEATSLGIWDIDLVTGERQWTPEARTTLGILANTPVTSETFLPCVHPEDRDRVRRWFARRSPNGAATYHDTFRIIAAGTGEEKWIAANGRDILDEYGQPIRKIGTVQDITERKRAEADLANKATLIEATLENMDQGLIMADSADRVTVFNRRALDLLDLPLEFMASGPLVQEIKAFQTRMGDIAPEDDEVLKSAQIGGLLSDPSIYERTRSNGTVLEIRTVPLPDGGAVRTYTDITARRQAEGALRASEKRLWLAFQAGRMFAWEQDLTTNYVTRSQHTVEWLGIGSGPLSEFIERFHPEDRHLRREFLDQILATGSGTMEFRYVLPDGQTLWLGCRGERAGPNRVVGVTFDITDRKSAEEEIWRIANHDPLTGLPNRMLFQHKLEQALTEAKQHVTSISLLVIDLDEFKDVNDSFGHDAGDALLKETAGRLSGVARDCDTVARLGGDEFVVLLTDSSLELAATLAEGITRKLSQPVSYAGQMIASRASIGVAAFPNHHGEPTELMKDADMALYRAKSEGRNRVVTYSPEMRAATEQRTALRREMREAISLDQIRPFYQPKVCLPTGEIIGFEALARWKHPTRGLLTPGTFGDIFDDPELATMVGKRLIGKVASDMRRWLSGGLSFGHVAINLSHVEFSQPDLAEDIFRVLDLAKVPPRYFEIEITEKVLLDAQSDAVSATLEKFRARGVQIALDDFGTGYASLTHLKEFAVDHIKIDQSFVRDIEDDPDDEAIVTAVVGLGRSLNLKVTAEGVETIGQAQRLREMGCGAAQGYLYAKPMAGSDVPDFLSGWSARVLPVKKLLLVER